MLDRAGLLPPSCSWGKGRDWLRGMSPDSDTVLLSPEPDTLSEPFLQNVNSPSSALRCGPTYLRSHATCSELALQTQHASKDLHAHWHVAGKML